MALAVALVKELLFCGYLRCYCEISCHSGMSHGDCDPHALRDADYSQGIIEG